MLDAAIQKVPNPFHHRTELLEAQVAFAWLHQKALESQAQTQPGDDGGVVQTTPAAAVVSGLYSSNDEEVNPR